MKKALLVLSIIGALLLITAIALGGTFVSRRNEMVAQKEAIKAAWASALSKPTVTMFSRAKRSMSWVATVARARR